MLPLAHSQSPPIGCQRFTKYVLHFIESTFEWLTYTGLSCFRLPAHLDIEGDVLGVADDDDVEVEVWAGHHRRPGG